MITAAIVRELIIAGLTGDDLLAALERIESADIRRLSADSPQTDEQAKRRRAADRERAKLKREQKKSADNPQTSADSEPVVPDKESFPHTPFKEINPPSPEIPTAREPRGFRLPDDFVPLPNVIEFARNLGFSDAEIKFEIAQFTDHWRAKAGSDARKTDWNATLRNWFRKAHGYRKNGTGRRQSPGEALRTAFAEQREFLNRPLPDS